MYKKKRIAIIGAGPGGLAAAMLLAHRGFEVRIFEKEIQPGGRTAEMKLGSYRFDIGPTFFMMKYVLDRIFRETGRKLDDHLEFIRLNPAYRLYFNDKYIDVFDDPTEMKEEIERVFPGESGGYDKFLKKEKKRFENLIPLLERSNNNISDVFSRRFLKALPYFGLGKSLYDVMGDYFDNPKTRLSFTFQSKYLGMSPWECPGAFGLVPYVEHALGVYHVKGGLSELSRKMAQVVQQEGGEIIYNSPVDKLILDGKRVKGVKLTNGEKYLADYTIINADFGYAVSNLFPEGVLKKYSSQKLKKKDFSCSIFIMYLGLNKQYRLHHNTIIFADKYKKNVEDVFGGKLSGDDISLYVRDHSLTDPSLAPLGKTALYVLVPVPNNRADIDWQDSQADLRRWTLNALKRRLGMEDIEDHIEVEKIITPDGWQNDFNVHLGAVFNLAHHLNQMMWLRPHNEFEEVKNCYLVGGGTHPGSGLPTIYQSGQIAADLISRKEED